MVVVESPIALVNYREKLKVYECVKFEGMLQMQADRRSDC